MQYVKVPCGLIGEKSLLFDHTYIIKHKTDRSFKMDQAVADVTAGRQYLVKDGNLHNIYCKIKIVT
jgi:hypothetical protein